MIPAIAPPDMPSDVEVDAAGVGAKMVTVAVAD